MKTFTFVFGISIFVGSEFSLSLEKREKYGRDE